MALFASKAMANDLKQNPHTVIYSGKESRNEVHGAPNTITSLGVNKLKLITIFRTPLAL